MVRVEKITGLTVSALLEAGCNRVEEKYDHFLVDVLVPIADTILLSLKKKKLDKIIADRDNICVSNVTVHSRSWQADSRSQELLGQAITLATAGLPLPQVWRDADNNDMTITSISDLLAIAGAIAAQTQQAYTISWQRKTSLNNATTVQEVEAI